MFLLKNKYNSSNYLFITKYFLKWLGFALIIGSLVGITCAFLLAGLNWSTNYREDHKTIIWLLPIGGLLVGLLYHYYGKSIAKGNNQIIEELNTPKNIIPFKMAPFIFIGTVISHLFGASVGREGTAVQIGAAIADQFSGWFKMNKHDRRTILIMGISSGFAGLFGTPLAGAIFAIEVFSIGKVKYNTILPSILVAVIANFVSSEVAHYLHVPHTYYHIDLVPKLNLTTLFWCLLVGIIFGVASTFFSKGVTFFSAFSKYIKYPPLRPVFGGFVIAVLVYFIGTKYIGLGISTIVDSFTITMNSYDFVLKILLTTFCIAFGFKGGEVTPLFFIGATLGSALSIFVPLPIGLLAGMGFVAVFSGATNTPIACTLMGIELFGMESGIYIAIACITAYIFSGHTGIYSSQQIGIAKTDDLLDDEGLEMNNI